MYEHELQRYCERHGYKVVRMYTTLGEGRANHQRAIVTTPTNETHYLYYDESRKRRSLARQKRDLDIYQAGGIPELPPCRGWRNTTLDNRRKREAINRRHEEANQP